MDANTFITDPFLHSVLAAAELAQTQCMQMLDFLDRNRSSDESETTELELSKQQKLLNTHLARLRRLNRKAVLDTRSTKQQTAEAKSEIDTLHLQLQNLYYEQRHLRGEIAACEGYDHKYQSLPLISADEFLETHSDLREADERDLMIARINHEHAERQALEEQRQGLLKKKQSLIAQNNEKKEELTGLDKEVEKFVNAAAAVEKKFEAHASKKQVVAA
ncbi:hypothetical protein BT93_L1388 [Corymbia citriodora subsp. variegata]|uniref:THO complex subunit 5 n=1 Tax=Corymbia citriodora subsp. variegata TaxID=360336 RepID=A0A8T0CEF6_CORYI|nr:hypothetical protein BT93_L1388 [Corymbia citriodora subsp. variegata]